MTDQWCAKSLHGVKAWVLNIALSRGFPSLHVRLWASMSLQRCRVALVVVESRHRLSMLHPSLGFAITPRPDVVARDDINHTS